MALNTGNLLITTTLDIIENIGQIDSSYYIIINHSISKSLRINIGYGSTKTAFTVAKHINRYLRVILSQTFPRPVRKKLVAYT
jgi:hypothetical protein